MKRPKIVKAKAVRSKHSYLAHRHAKDLWLVVNLNKWSTDENDHGGIQPSYNGKPTMGHLWKTRDKAIAAATWVINQHPDRNFQFGLMKLSDIVENVQLARPTRVTKV